MILIEEVVAINKTISDKEKEKETKSQKLDQMLEQLKQRERQLNEFSEEGWRLSQIHI